MGSEATIVLRLRAIILVMLGLGIMACAIGTEMVRFYALCFFIPGGWAYISPRWPAILVWIMSGSTIGLLGVLIGLGDRPLFQEPSHWLLGAVAVLLFVALPLVRRMHEAPNYRRGRSRIPEARIHRRDS